MGYVFINVKTRIPKRLEQFEDTKEITRIRKSTKNRQHNDKKGQTTIYKTLHIKLNIEQHNPTKNGGKLRCSGRVNTETQATLGSRHRMKTNK